MTGYQLIRRLEIILSMLDNNTYLSKESIINRLMDLYDIRVSTRTLERDFKSLDVDFGIEIIYDKKKNGYTIDNTSTKENSIPNFFKFTELIQIGELFKEGIQDFNSLKSYVELENIDRLKGVHNLKPILLAIKQEEDISFIHEHYYNETFKQHHITPLKIKEYLNRWYVIGIPKGEKQLKTYGIDRITALKKEKKQRLNKKPYLEQLGRYNQVIGLSFAKNDTPEIVKLKVELKQLKYLQSLPMHSSQRIEMNPNDPYGIVSYFLIPNYEFKIEILKLNNTAEVIEPKWLREEIKRLLVKTLEKYQ